MSKFYAVQLTVTAIVQVADDEDELFAEKWALDHKRDIVADNPMGVKTLCEVHSQADLRPFGWDGMCLPYAGDGNTRLQDLLPKDARGVMMAGSTCALCGAIEPQAHKPECPTGQAERELRAAYGELAAPAPNNLMPLVDALEAAAISYGGSSTSCEPKARATLKQVRDAVDAAIDGLPSAEARREPST